VNKIEITLKTNSVVSAIEITLKTV